MADFGINGLYSSISANLV